MEVDIKELWRLQREKKIKLVTYQPNMQFEENEVPISSKGLMEYFLEHPKKIPALWRRGLYGNRPNKFYPKSSHIIFMGSPKKGCPDDGRKYKNPDGNFFECLCIDNGENKEVKAKRYRPVQQGFDAYGIVPVIIN